MSLLAALLFVAIVIVPQAGASYFLLAHHFLEECGQFADRKPSDKELSNVLKRHNDWLLEVWSSLSSDQKEHGDERLKALADPRRANLCMADLSGRDLSNKNLAAANLIGANLSSADLTNTNLSWANLSGGLTGGWDVGGQMPGWDLVGWFSRFTIPKTDLSGAILSRTDMSNAYLYNAILSSAIFEPRVPGSSDGSVQLPDLDSLATSTGLSRLRYENSPRALTQARNEFQDAGYVVQAREVAAAIRRTADLNALHTGLGVSALSAAVSFGLLGLTCDYGARPGLALMWLCVLLLLGAAVYVDCLLSPREKFKIAEAREDPGKHGEQYCVSADFFLKSAQRMSSRVKWSAFIGLVMSLLLTVPFISGEGVPLYPGLEILAFATGWGRVVIALLIAAPFWAAISLVGLWRPRILRALAGGLWFSVIVTFRIGWRDLSLGTWLSRLQPRPFVLEPVGWLRTFAGIQSILGIYLLGLLLLTYFRPLFEVG